MNYKSLGEPLPQILYCSKRKGIFMPGILYTAYQKFYSALNCLERSNKDKDFFENISNLDEFLGV